MYIYIYIAVSLSLSISQSLSISLNLSVSLCRFSYNVNIYIYIYIYIRRPLQSVERVRLHLLAPKQAASQPASKAARQQGSQDLAVDSRIWQLTDYLSSYRGPTPPPQAATGRQTLSPPFLPRALKSVLLPARKRRA